MEISHIRLFFESIVGLLEDDGDVTKIEELLRGGKWKKKKKVHPKREKRKTLT